MSDYKIKLLIIDDEKLIGWSLAKQFEKDGYQTFTALSGEEGLEVFRRESPEVVFLDNRLPKKSGLEVLKEIRHHSQSTIVIFMTAYGSTETAVEAMKLGAYDYVNKPFQYNDVNSIVEQAVKANKLDAEVLDIRRKLMSRYGFSSIIGESSQMMHIFEIIRKITHSEASTVLIYGESGTGKEVVARAIHYESNRFQKPFVAINCAALPETLLESELFGYERGAFTDAKQMKRGQFELAEGGTLLLDEIGELSIQMQVKLLRALETRTFKRLGGTQDTKIDVRVIAATNRDLQAAIAEGRFRQDLYFRLKVVTVQLPPLRERPEDILILSTYFINHFNREFSKKVTGLDEPARCAMLAYEWPGNVRELKNVIEHSLVLENDTLIRLEHLPIEILGKKPQKVDPSAVQLEFPVTGFPLEEIEKLAIQKALNYANGNQSKAAALLSVTRDTIRYKMKKFGLLD
ncbi:MAG: sigma-54 dependent transcriptional regulator [bacterium]|nr:sigma-54 dependent transcriptional regulator [bacterium]